MVKYRLFFSSSKQEKKEWTFTWQSQLTTPQNILITMRAREKTKRIAEKKAQHSKQIHSYIHLRRHTHRILLAKNQNTKNSDYVFYQKKNIKKFFFCNEKLDGRFIFLLRMFLSPCFSMRNTNNLFFVRINKNKWRWWW